MFSKGMVCLLTMGALALSWAMPAHAMNKAELVEAMASHAGLSKADSKKALDGFINATSSALRSGDRVSLQNFGSFGVRVSVADASGKSSIADVDFVAGRAFNASDDAQANNFSMTVSGPGDFRDLDSDGDGIPDAVEDGDGVLFVRGDGEGRIAKGDRVMLERGHPGNAPAHSNAGGRGRGRDADDDDDGIPTAEVLAVVVILGGGVTAVDDWQGPVAGLVLRGIDKKDIRRGMVIAKPQGQSEPGVSNPLYEDDRRGGSNPLYQGIAGHPGGGIQDDYDILEVMVKESGIGVRNATAAYNALLNIIVDEVNAGRFVDLAGFGRFGEETTAVVQIIDLCAGDPEACLQDIDDPELLRELLANDFVENEVSVAISEGDFLLHCLDLESARRILDGTLEREVAAIFEPEAGP